MEDSCVPVDWLHVNMLLISITGEAEGTNTVFVQKDVIRTYLKQIALQLRAVNHTGPERSLLPPEEARGFNQDFVKPHFGF